LKILRQFARPFKLNHIDTKHKKHRNNDEEGKDQQERRGEVES